MIGRLARASRGVAMLEFAIALPVFLVMSLTGAELTNYITVRMRLSQVALQLADNAARMGTGGQLILKTISEADINDLFIGAELQSDEMHLGDHGRVILSSVEEDPDHPGKYKIGWQRCYGTRTSHPSTYGTYNTASGRDMTGMGPDGQKITAPTGGATMFVEVYYEYQPIVDRRLAPSIAMTEIASMMVRDTRDLTQIRNDAAASNC
ncbi:MAG: TadE/TadG family type IV pilus assembly protein [Pseudomonadota bacterium]